MAIRNSFLTWALGATLKPEGTIRQTATSGFTENHQKGSDMLNRIQKSGLVTVGAGLLVLAGCGGGGGGSSTASVATTTPVTVQVIDGAIQGAIVCLDTNKNGVCDAGEPQGTTNASGSVTFQADTALVGKYPVVAMIGTNAVDVVNGPVTTAYTMSTTADQTGFVTPLTTLVQQTVASTGSTTAAAAQSIQDATGISVSLFADPLTIGTQAVTLARMLVLTSQQLNSTLTPAVGTTAMDNTVITATNVTKVVQDQLLSLLPSVVTAAANGTPTAATATTLVGNAGITSNGAAVLVAVSNQTTAAQPTTNTAFANLVNLNFTDAANFFFREFTGTAAQATPDASGNSAYVERRVLSAAGKLSKWGSGGNPASNSIFQWNGKAWSQCAPNYANGKSSPDAAGNNAYNYCDSREIGISNRATFDISGQSMLTVYNRAIASGYNNLLIANASSILGGANFPANSKLILQSGTSLANAISYYPGDMSWTGFSNNVIQYSLGVAQGGDATKQAANTLCNSAETNSNGTNSSKFESMMATKTGTPCSYPPNSFSSGGVTYTSPTPNEWWGNSTVHIGDIGSAPVNSGTATSYFTGNTIVRAAFTGTGNGITYLSCSQRFSDGSSRNCKSIGSGTYAISTLGDARVMTFANLPAITANFNTNLVLVERGGHIYRGFQSKPQVSKSYRLDITAGAALLTQLGITPEDPTLPVALTAGSYQGYYALTSDANNHIQLILNADGTSVCKIVNGIPGSGTDTWTQSPSCTITVTDAAAGAFNISLTPIGGGAALTGTGTINFMTGALTLPALGSQAWTGNRL